jgi:hypothetical protein
MNQTFSFQRFSLLVAKNWAENKKRYLLSLVAYISLVFVWYVFVMLTDESHPMAKNLQEVTFLFSLLLVGPFFASQFFSELGSKTKATSYLMVPASNLEKLLCSILYVTVLFLILFIAAFYFVDFIAVLIANAFHPSYNDVTTVNGVHIKAQAVNIFKVGKPSDNVAFYFLTAFFAVQSVALLGSVYFQKYGYIKTVISLTLILLISSFLVFEVMGSILPSPAFFSGVEYRIFDGEKMKIVELPKWSQKLVEYLLFFGFTIVFWVATYFRLKEKEV